MAVAFVFVLLGILFAVIALLVLLRTRSFLGRAKETRGTVTEMVYSRSSDGGGGYYPVYQFKTSEGQTIVKQHSMSSNPPSFKVGQEVSVLYEPDKPNSARINTRLSLYFMPVLFGGMGLLFIVVGAVVVFL